MNPRTKLEQLKVEVRDALETDLLAFKKAIIREIDALWRMYSASHPGETLESFARYLLNAFNIPANVKNDIIRELKATQRQIANVWEDYFKASKNNQGNIFINYEKLGALYSVDFKEINKDVRNFVVKEFRQSVNNNYSFETVRTKLQKSNLSTGSVYTLANTAVSQFDNASMFEYAQQAGIKEFVYDGILSPNSRLFCIEHYKKTYTYEEILDMDNGQGIPVVTSCGGYNCHHYWTPKI